MTGMFARDFVRVDRPFEAVAPRFTAGPGWLEPIFDTALDNAAASLPRRDRPPGPIPGGEPARCSQGPIRVREDALVVPWTWTWTFERDPFALSPVESDLTIAPVHPTQCALTLEARAKPPAVSLPTGAQHMVDEVLRGFLRGLAAAIVGNDAPPAREGVHHG